MSRLTMKDAMDPKRREHRLDADEADGALTSADDRLHQARRRLEDARVHTGRASMVLEGGAEAQAVTAIGEQIDQSLIALVQAHAHVTGDSTEITIMRLLEQLGLSVMDLAQVHNVATPWDPSEPGAVPSSEIGKVGA